MDMLGDVDILSGSGMGNLNVAALCHAWRHAEIGDVKQGEDMNVPAWKHLTKAKAHKDTDPLNKPYFQKLQSIAEENRHLEVTWSWLTGFSWFTTTANDAYTLRLGSKYLRNCCTQDLMYDDKGRVPLILMNGKHSESDKLITYTNKPREHIIGTDDGYHIVYLPAQHIAEFSGVACRTSYPEKIFLAMDNDVVPSLDCDPFGLTAIQNMYMSIRCRNEVLLVDAITGTAFYQNHLNDASRWFYRTQKKSLVSGITPFGEDSLRCHKFVDISMMTSQWVLDNPAFQKYLWSLSEDPVSPLSNEDFQQVANYGHALTHFRYHEALLEDYQRPRRLLCPEIEDRFGLLDHLQGMKGTNVL